MPRQSSKCLVHLWVTQEAANVPSSTAQQLRLGLGLTKSQHRPTPTFDLHRLNGSRWA